MSCVVHVENAPQERRILFGMFGGKDREMRIREAYHVKDQSCSTGIAAIIEYEKMSSVSTAISAWNGRSQHINGPPLKVQEVNLEFYCSILKKLYEKDIALRELQQEHDKLRKTLQAELPKGPKAMTSHKLAEGSSSYHDTTPSRPTSEQAPSLSAQSTLHIPVSSWRVDAKTHVTPHGMELPHNIAPGDLFPSMIAAFDHVQEIVERGYKDASHGVGQTLSRNEIKDVNRGSIFFREGDEQRIVSSLGEERGHRRRKTHEDIQTNVLHTYSNGRIAKQASSSIRSFSTDPCTRTRTRKFGHPIPSPSSTWQTTTPTPAHPSLPCRKRLGGSLREASGIGTVTVSEAILKGYIEGQTKDKQQDARQGTLGYHRSLA